MHYQCCDCLPPPWQPCFLIQGPQVLQASAGGEPAPQRHAFLHDFCLCIPYGALIALGGLVMLFFGAERSPLIAGAGVALVLLSNLSLKAWRARRAHTLFTALEAGASVGWLPRPAGAGLGWLQGLCAPSRAALRLSRLHACEERRRRQLSLGSSMQAPLPLQLLDVGTLDVTEGLCCCTAAPPPCSHRGRRHVRGVRGAGAGGAAAAAHRAGGA